MDRRSFLTAGSGLVAAGAAATAALTSNSGAALAAAAQTTPTIFSFGAVGDGYTDDAPAFSKALQWAAANGQMVVVPAGKYGIASTVTFNSQGNAGQGWGLIAQGANLISRITNGADVMRLQSYHIVRYFKLIGSLSIVGSGTDGNGLHIVAYGANPSFYNFLIDGLSIERCGTNGLNLDGDVFECTISNSYFQDMKQDGATLANDQGGVISTVNFVNCFFNQNGRYGLSTFMAGSQYGGPQYVQVYGGYCRQNQSYGFYYNNGTGVYWIDKVGFENNCMSKQPGDPSGAHVYALTNMNMRDCTGFDMMGGATYLLQGWWLMKSTLDGCSNWSAGAMANTGKSKLLHMNGNNQGSVVLNNCQGGFDGQSGTGLKWLAVNCTGPSPWGNLNPIGTMSGTF
jgi:pectate lyase-like protein